MPPFLSEMLEKLLYAMAVNARYVELTKIPQWHTWATTDVKLSADEVNHILRLIPAGSATRVEGDKRYIDYKDVTLIYSADERTWLITQNKKRIAE